MNQKEFILKEKKLILNSFPMALRNELSTLLDSIIINSQYQGQGTFHIKFQNEILNIPTRIYWEEPKLLEPSTLSQTQINLLKCIYTRHHNGCIREKYLKKIIDSNFEWSSVFILQLCGEYIIEILELVYQHLLKSSNQGILNTITENPKYWALTKNRIVSYWNCYYRKSSRHPKVGFCSEDYVGFKIIKLLEAKKPKK